MGDFNARVCNKDDFVDADDFLTHHLALMTPWKEVLIFHQNLKRQIYGSTLCPKTK